MRGNEDENILNLDVDVNVDILMDCMIAGNHPKADNKRGPKYYYQLNVRRSFMLCQSEWNIVEIFTDLIEEERSVQ